MSLAAVQNSPNRSLRRRILACVGALVLLSLLGSTISLYRITEVNGSLDSINRISVPLGRLLAQMQSDADVFRREMERGLGNSHWSDPHWHPRPIPRWIGDILENEVERASELIKSNTAWTTPESRNKWNDWASNVSQGLNSLRDLASKLYVALQQHDEAAAAEIYPRWSSSLEEWSKQLQWGVSEYERSLRQIFALAENQVVELRTGLEMILIVVVSLSFLLLWLGERALRPLSDLTRLAREITRRGLRKEDKSLLAEYPITRKDEVSQLAREFHRMATSLLEREKTVETQRNRVQEQNRLLREMGALNENILNSIESILIVTDLEGKITQCNPGASRWLGKNTVDIIGTSLLSWPQMHSFPGVESWSAQIKENPEAWRIEPHTWEGRIYGGHLMPLKHEDGKADGAIIVLDDLTAEKDLQERLRRAENMAAVGRMSAQVAHEVRNPLHSIGLEAEVALEMGSKLGNSSLKQSLQSILHSVDRLEKITENYLKLSRLSSGEKKKVDLGEVLESVLAIYASVCESQGVQVDWSLEERADLTVWVDRDLLEQVLGNLMKNSLQALEGFSRSGDQPKIIWHLGNAESGRVWFSMEDNGPGIPAEIRSRLFTPFATTRAQGTGLGLSFVKKVLEDHGGTIVSLEHVDGKGARFEMTLPSLSSSMTHSFSRAEEANSYGS